MGALQNYWAKLQDKRFRAKLQAEYDRQMENYREAVSEEGARKKITRELNKEINDFLTK